MMKSIKRFATVLAMLALCVCLMAVSAYAAEEVASGTCGEDLIWVLDDEGTLTISGNGAMPDFESDGAPWYPYRRQMAIYSVVVEEGVTSIGDNAFYECENMTDIAISESVASIGEDSFNNCYNLTSVTIPNGVTEIPHGAFYDCNSLTSVIIPDSVTSIGDFAFMYCYDLASVAIPGSVTSIGKSAFAHCKSLPSITIPDSVDCIGESSFYYCTGLACVTVPDDINIGADAFRDCAGLADENGFVIVGDILFDYMGSATDVVIPQGVTRIDGAFAACIGLCSVTIPNSVTSIGDSAFAYCGSLTSVTIPDSVTSIGNSAFELCSQLTSVTIPDSVTDIGEYAFTNCRQLKSVTIPRGVTSIGVGAFEECSSLTSLTIPNSVTSISNSAFAYCSSLPSITIPDSVTSIGNYAFRGCSALISVVLPDNGIVIGGGAFLGCDGLADEDGFVVLKDVLYDYIGTAQVPVIPANVTSISSAAFCDSTSMKTLTIPDSVTSIGTAAFERCTGLTCITIPDSVTSIGEAAFSRCSGLTSVVLPDNDVVIGDSAFLYCDGLADKDGFVILDNVLYYYAGNVEEGTRLVVPAGVTRISRLAFGERVWLTSVTSIVLPAGVTSIGESAFYGCGSMTSITIPGSLSTIDDEAFVGCYELTDIYYTGTESQWAEISVGSRNQSLLSATIHYNQVPMLDTPVITKLENTATGIEITWKPVEDAEMYRVYAKTSTGWLALGTTSDTSFTYTRAISGYTYIFTVRCLNADGTEFTSSFNSTGWFQKYVAQPSITKFENTASGIKITWNAVAGAGKYRIYVKVSDGPATWWEAVGNTTGTSFTYTKAISGNTYTFTICATNAAGTDYVSSRSATGWSQEYVAQPVITKLENTAGGIKLTWDAVAGAGKYRVYAKTSKGWLALGTTTANSFTYTGAKSGYTYTFTVRAMNAAGTAFVSSFNATGWKQTYVAQPAISKLENTANGIKITWNAVAGAGKYRVYAKTSKGWLALGTTTSNSFVYTGAKSGYTYTFTVRALNAAGTAFVSSFNATGWKQTYIAQPAVTKLTNSTSGITITWGKVNGAAKYRIFVKTDSGWKTIGTTAATSFTWTGAQAGVTYTFTVRCVNAANNVFTSSYNTSGWTIKRT